MKICWRMMVLLVAALQTTVAAGTPPFGYSGMAPLAENSFLVIADRKAQESGSRVGVLTVTPTHGPVLHPLDEEDALWGSAGKPNDLEACCAVPGRPEEFLLVESGRFREQYGRIHHVRIVRNNDAWRLQALSAFAAYERPVDAAGSTLGSYEIEGAACCEAFGKLVLCCGERGGEGSFGRLVWGELDLEKQQFLIWGVADLAGASILGGRNCSDIWLRRAGETYTVWSVAASDPGELGPFRSAVYRAGSLEPSLAGILKFRREPTPEVQFRLDGLKVEALSAPAAAIPDSFCSVATDEEQLGGVWRPLARRSEAARSLE